MTKPNSIPTIALALNAEEGSAPEWIQLTPEGPTLEGRDGRVWKMSSPQDVIDAFNKYGSDLPIDFEHATQVKGDKGEAAHAVGWIKQLEARNNAIWARVDWNDAGSEAVTSKSYRYVSPVFGFKPSTGEVTAMRSAGLTNMPNFNLTALNKQGDAEETAVSKLILAALGLKEDASDEDVVIAINKIKRDEQTALNRAEQPDSSKFVPKADYDLALNKIGEFEEADKGRQDEVIIDAVGAAIKAGKIAPASKGYHEAACRQDGGLEAFNKMVGASPEIAAKSDLDKNPNGGSITKLSDEEVAACKALGMSAEDFAKAKAEDNSL